jgi:hypothetical protein
MTALALTVGIGNLLIGAAYSGLGLLSLWEALSQYRYRGLSRFGLGFTLMAASCGPHHLVHGWCVLQGGVVNTPMLVITLVGLPAGFIFSGLRLEAMLGGRGDRTVLTAPHALVALTTACIAMVGVLATQALAMRPLPGGAMCTMLGLQVAASAGAGTGFLSLVFVANLCAAAAYLMVGWYLAVTQVRRYVAQQQWSLSGLALTAVFPTCAFMHVIHAFSMGAHSATLPFDLLGVPASIYFLWVVKRVHGDSVVDWNRRPLAGVAGTPERSSPWSGLHDAR